MNSRIAEVRKVAGLSQREFAEKIGLTRNFVSLVETGERAPSDRTIADICREFNVNETWLRTGEGDMFNELSKEDQVTRFVAKILRSPDAAFQRALIVALSELPPEAWEIWADFVLSLGDEYKKQKGQPPDGS